MSSRRAPLANVPSAINSPFRTQHATNGKRTRAQAGENAYGQPPAKKQIIEIKEEDEENMDPKRRSAVTVVSNEKLDGPFEKRASHAPLSAFEKKLASVREKKPTTAQQQQSTRPVKASNDIESVRQWQRHYRRQFPHFVFYFDKLPDDVRLKATRQIQSLGAREEKFFSKAVTHVVTTRQIPPEATHTSPDDDLTAAKLEDAQGKVAGTVSASQDQRRTTSLLDANLQRRAQAQGVHTTHDPDSRRAQAHANPDILHKARELGIKLWALEKLHRVLSTMLQADAGDHGHDTATIVAHNVRITTKPARNVDLEQMLRNEKINGPADRDLTVAQQDMSTFRGCYIYIHDMDERTKPVMVRDYAKPASKEQGKWPQFRLTAPGRCPFIEDQSYTKKLMEQERHAMDAKAQQEIAAARRTRAASALEAQPLAERHSNLRRSPRKLAQADDLTKPLDPPKLVPSKRSHEASQEEMPPLFGSAQVGRRGLPRMVGGEPIASGVQPSNVTSAIRSQIVSSNISSTAPGFNRRIGDSKEVSALKRKVLERGASTNSNQSVPSSYMNDMRAAINDDHGPPARAAKRRAQETLGVVHEHDESGRKQAKPRKTSQRKKVVEKEPKPGYCENCRDKFDDFDEHILSRKHRKFAQTQDNWTELDALLCQLKRPHKEHC